MDSASSGSRTGALVAVFKTAKAACFNIIAPVLVTAENCCTEKQLLENKISVLESEHKHPVL